MTAGDNGTSDEPNDNAARRQAELELLSAAFSPEEAWCEGVDTDSPAVHRQLILKHGASLTVTTTTDHPSSQQQQHHQIPILLSLQMVPNYPETEPLEVSVQITRKEQQRSATDSLCAPSSSRLVKLVYDEGISSLLSHCQTMAASMEGSEGIFSVLSAADEWAQDIWPVLVQERMKETSSASSNTSKNNNDSSSNNGPTIVVLGRRLIYSHHIISKQKRKDLQDLAQQYQLTGYVKIGWPGLILIEGQEEDCCQFYDNIRQWAWQYLVVRGEMQENISVPESSITASALNAQRRLVGFHEVSEMSTVANACREVDLEALFKTSMKIYESDSTDDQATSVGANKSDCCYGVVMHVDHMNNPKAYRKWLTKTSAELGTLLIVKHVALNYDSEQEDESPQRHNHQRQTHRVSSYRPIILVIILGCDKRSVSLFLKKWRSSFVDVNSQGQPCLERQMKVVVEGPLDFSSFSSSTAADKTTTTTNGDQRSNKSYEAHHPSDSDFWHALVRRHSIYMDDQYNDDRPGQPHEFALACNPSDMVHLVASMTGSPDWVKSVELFLSSFTALRTKG
ncbi:hypothetical protein ACA910_021367 [Epithemia clementina (nom. ined.)]